MEDYEIAENIEKFIETLKFLEKENSFIDDFIDSEKVINILRDTLSVTNEIGQALRDIYSIHCDEFYGFLLESEDE